jgi:predicted nucleotidyltransferase
MDHRIWQDFVGHLREGGTSRNRIKDLQSDMDDLLKGGSKKAQEGSPFKPAKYNFRRKKFNDISAPPSAPGGGAIGNPGPALEEEVDPKSFDTHESLDPRLWNEEHELRRPISQKLIKIAEDFIEGMPIEIDIEDIRLTGSLANYNWSNYSDVDLHIVVDFLNIDENLVLVKSFFDNARMRWNNNHHIQIKGYDVEIYVENVNESHHSSAIYSITNKEWIKEPTKFRSSIDFLAARQKADDLAFQVNIVQNLIDVQKFKAALTNIERLKKKIKNMRRAGLESTHQEFSVENITFKILRRDGILERLSDLKKTAYDDMMSYNGEKR